MKAGDEPPLEVFFDEHGDMWAKTDYGEDWLWLGIAPRPKNHFHALMHHIAHGVLMGYPIFDVLAWSWQHRNSFDEHKQQG